MEHEDKVENRKANASNSKEEEEELDFNNLELQLKPSGRNTITANSTNIFNELSLIKGKPSSRFSIN